MRARETDVASDAFGDDVDKLKPIIDDPEQSDTASVDNALELLLQGGQDLPTRSGCSSRRPGAAN